MLVGESGTTDYAAVLLRCFAAEGVVQGHRVIVVGQREWGRKFPGVVRGKEKRSGGGEMKIAWRYRSEAIGG